MIFNIGNQQLFQIKEGSCNAGNRTEVNDAELHAIQEAASALFTITAPLSSIFFCIDNLAAIDTLQFNQDNHEYARHALESVAKFRILGWQINTLWCPLHCGLPCNKQADMLAKLGTSFHTPCQYALTTKIWLQSQA